MSHTPWLTWVIVGLGTAGIIVRPFKWPEFIWAVAAAVLLVVIGLL
ncbi:MAG: arsenic transporter, partial [Pseudomonadota bacterium]|nr:arsenic transporter [Pseudomonadota bacterium]